MKKLMFTAAAALCATVGLAIESANTVGYTAPTLSKSLQNTGVCFMTPDGQDIDIQAIKPSSNNKEATDGSFTMRWFNAGKYDYAVWCAPLYADEEGETELDYNGWGDRDYLMPITKTFSPGQWFLVQPNSATVNPTLTVAGAIVTSDTTTPTYSVALQKALQATGNPFPTTCDIQSIVPISNDKEANDGTFQIRWFNGGKYDYAVWCAPLYADEEGETELDYNGWGDRDYLMPITKTFGVGEGFLVQPNSATVNPKLAFPNPLYSGN